MALLSVIRRWHLRQHIPIREIERRTGLSRNTIRQYLRADAVEPKFKLPDRPTSAAIKALQYAKPSARLAPNSYSCRPTART